MNSARHVGRVGGLRVSGLRVGGLAAAFGVGAALLSSVAVASADSGSPDASGASSPAATRGPSAGRPARSTIRSAPARAVPPGSAATAAAPRLGAVNNSGSAAIVSEDATLSRATTAVPVVPQRRSSGSVTRATASSADTSPAGTTGPEARALSPTPAAAAAPAALPTPAAATALSSMANPDALAPVVSPRVLGITALSTAGTFAFSMMQQFGIATHFGASNSTYNQTVKLAGYDLVPDSTELVTSFYGPWTYGPGGLNLVQGQQRYTVVDSATQQTLGAFDALVTSGSPLGLTRYAHLLVTSAEAGADTEAGQGLPVGSVIANMNFAGFGWRYSALPGPSGSLVSLAVTTPFGDIPLRSYTFDAAKGIADHTVDNRPIDLGNGYSIAPSDPDGEIYTGTSGLLPFFQTVQTRQQFDVRDSSGATVGSFEGVATTTWDVFGVYTEAIMVTESHGDNVGTALGQVPPPGTVYNVAYNGRDDDWALYTSMPSPSGSVISMLEGVDGAVSNVLTFPVNRLDASTPPPSSAFRSRAVTASSRFRL